MAAVPENEAGVGSAVNDVSRQLGGALGVAVIGSVVSSSYRTFLGTHEPANVPSIAVRASQRSIGVATESARRLPARAAAALTNAADHAYVHAITRGFAISIGVMVLALVAALVLLPRRPRADQATTEPAPPETIRFSKQRLSGSPR
jgi:DHA2 family multidrug resistance protein-like MFS transporter